MAIDFISVHQSQSNFVLAFAKKEAAQKSHRRTPIQSDELATLTDFSCGASWVLLFQMV